MAFTIESKANVILIYQEAKNNTARDATLYAEIYPDHPSHWTFGILFEKLRSREIWLPVKANDVRE
jgi:hypothetical protein